MIPDPADYGLKLDRDDCLMMDGVKLTEVASEFGTPVHVVNEQRLKDGAKRFIESAQNTYPGRVSVHFAFKSNSVPGIVELAREAGLKAEVMSEYELRLALGLGYDKHEIIVNGPCKTREFLGLCVQTDVRLIIVDSLEELNRIEEICRDTGRKANLLLRINPGFRPGKINRGSVAASRKASPFGIDLAGGEVEKGLDMIRNSRYLDFQGFHFHIGTGISRSADYALALGCLSYLREMSVRRGLELKVLDVGGGFPTPTSRELSDREMLLYQAFGFLPRFANRRDPLEKFLEQISGSIRKSVGGTLPELIFEPGRSITSQSQALLLRVHYVKRRGRKLTWLITDGGLGTVTMPTFYEYHEIFPCCGSMRPRKERVNIIGPACFSGDIVYRNKLMPTILPGEVLAVMDSGAYFTALESSFGFFRPAMVGISGGKTEMIRRRESFDDAISRDFTKRELKIGDDENEIRCGKRRVRPSARFNRRRGDRQVHRKWRRVNW